MRLAFHRQAQLSFDERLDEKSQEIQGKERLDAHGVFEEHGRDLVHGLDLLEALLDGRLPFMGLEDLGGGQVTVVAKQRIHAVALFVVVDGGLIDRPFQVVAASGDSAVLGVGSGTTAVSLLEGVLGAGDALDLEVTARMVLLEDQLDLQIDARPAAHPGARPQDAPAQSP